MRRLLLSLLFVVPAARAEEAPPKVSKVVLYSDAALVTRAVDAPCGEGPLAAKFTSLPPSLDPATLRAAIGVAGGRIEGVSVSERVRAEPYSEDVRALDQKLDELRDKATLLERQVERANTARARAEALREGSAPFIAREAAMVAKPNVDAWSVALDTTRAGIEAADQQRRAAETELREVRRTIQETEEKRGRLANAAPERAWDAEVVYRCASGRAKVELGYVTLGASWTPAYEARLDEASGSVAFAVMADVSQRTGEAWDDVEVTLSTASSRRDSRPPKAQRLYVGASEQEEQKKVLVRREEAAGHVAATTGGESAGAVAAQDQGLSVQLAVPGRSDLAGDGRPARLTVETLKLPATTGPLTIPKLLPVVFRAAKLRNAARYPLLAGRVDLFSNGAFIGTTPLPRTAEGDDVKLAFGIDEKIKVRRVTVSEEKTEAGIFSSTRALAYAYRIELENSGSKAVEVAVQEHVPVSEMDDVKVTIDDKTTKGYEQVATDGLLTWKVSLKAGEKKSVDVAFRIDIPTKYESGGI